MDGFLVLTKWVGLLALMVALVGSVDWLDRRLRRTKARRRDAALASSLAAAPASQAAEPPQPIDGPAPVPDPVTTPRDDGRPLGRMRCWCEYCDIADPDEPGPPLARRCPTCNDYRCARSAHHNLPCSKKDAQAAGASFTW